MKYFAGTAIPPRVLEIPNGSGRKSEMQHATVKATSLWNPTFWGGLALHQAMSSELRDETFFFFFLTEEATKWILIGNACNRHAWHLRNNEVRMQIAPSFSNGSITNTGTVLIIYKILHIIEPCIHLRNLIHPRASRLSYHCIRYQKNKYFVSLTRDFPERVGLERKINQDS